MARILLYMRMALCIGLGLAVIGVAAVAGPGAHAGLDAVPSDGSGSRL